MRASTLFSLAAICSAVTASLDGFWQYVNPLEYSDISPKLVKRQGCPGGYSNCGALGSSEACCPTNQVCARDANENVACCPIGAACTGTIGGPAAESGSDSTTGSGLIVGGPSSTTAPSGTAVTSTATATSGFLFPSGTTTEAPTFTASTVAGAVFPFVYIPTTFSNAAECSSYATKCADQYQSCLATLGGGVNGVTVSGANVGITVQGTSATVSGANNVCSSLSQRACYGLQTGICSQYGSGTATGGVASGSGGFVVGAAAQVTGCPGILYALGAGAVVGAGRGLL